MQHRLILPFLACLALAACEQREVDEQGQIIEIPMETASDCQPVLFEEKAFTHCIADPARHAISLIHADAQGEDYGSLGRFAAERPVSAPAVAFAIGGGVLEEEGEPRGYYVENGDRLRLLIRGEDAGAVFFGEPSADWRVWSAERFYNDVTQRPSFGMQSAPMLVEVGELSPQLSTEQAEPRLQSGIGIDPAGRAHFVISDEPVTPDSLARYFRDVVRTPNAVQLAGSSAALWDPTSERLDNRSTPGPLIIVEMRENGA